jgi:hypothetical protein
MTDIVTLQAQLETLKAAYRSGASSLSYEGKNVTYRDGNEMRTAIAALENEIAGLTGPAQPRSINIRSTKGW